MRQFVESLRRLYMARKISDKEVQALFEKKTIDQNELEYILDRK